MKQAIRFFLVGLTFCAFGLALYCVPTETWLTIQQVLIKSGWAKIIQEVIMVFGFVVFGVSVLSAIYRICSMPVKN
jgi:hypothetical protein